MLRRRVWISTLIGLAVILSTSFGFTFAQSPQPADPGPQQPSAHTRPVDQRRLHPGPGQRVVYAPNGQQSLVADLSLDSINSAESTVSTGGPDEYGYTWDNSGAFNWIDATGGVNTGLSNGSWGSQVSGSIPLGFNFKFYGNTYSEIYISTAGAAGFDQYSLGYEYSLGNSPSPDDPNNVIAPYMGSFLVNTASNPGKVYYKQGGSGSNHYFVVEWYQVKDDLGGKFTFETILYENGEIDFSYQSMVHASSYYCGWGAAIEDESGEDGLVYRDPWYCNNMQGDTGKTVRFMRPGPAARVGVTDLFQGSLTAPSAKQQFSVSVKNTGDLGADTYNLEYASSWPATLYQQDGMTLLADTDGNGQPDTGPVSPGNVAKFVVEIQTAPGVSLGDSNSAQLAIRSKVDANKVKTVTFQMAVPAPFLQAFRNETTAVGLSMIQTYAQADIRVPENNENIFDAGVLELPNGNQLITGQYYRCMDDSCDIETRGIEYGIVGPTGKIVRSLSPLTSNYSPTESIYDSRPKTAATPDGRIGIIWVRYLYNLQTYARNSNLFFAVLDSGGGLVFGPVNLTNNTAWYNGSALNIPSFDYPLIAATGDNRFVLGWERWYSAGSSWKDSIDDVYFSIRNSDGSLRKDITRLTNDVKGKTDGFYGPIGTSLSGNRALIAWESNDNGIQYLVLTSAGAIDKSVQSLGGVSAGAGFPEDAAQLSNGNIILSWNTSAGEKYTSIFYVILNSSAVRINGPLSLSPGGAKYGSMSSSIAPDKNGHAIITWTDANYIWPQHLFYALVNSDGSVRTPPQVMQSASTGESDFSYVETNYEGQGNTSYSWQPFANNDTWINAPALNMGPPAGVASIQVQFGNLGMATGSSVVLSATLGSGLVYASDDSGISPSVNGNEVTWTLPDQKFLDQGQFTLRVSLPDEALGTSHPLDLTIQTGGADGNMANNAVHAQVTAARQLFLPVIVR